jgi:hypothetical protein
LPVGPKAIDLDEGAGQLFGFPWRGRFTCPQADRDILDPHRLAGLQRQVADNAVALVEQADHRDALGHRRHPWLVGRSARHVDRDGLILCFVCPISATACSEQQGKGEDGGKTGHAYSGFHAS